MSALTPETHSVEIAKRLSSSELPCVICLCAAWCTACERYRAIFDALAQAHPEVCFIWIDIEVHANSLGEVEIDDFPTLLLEDAKGVRFFGPVLPYPLVIEQLLSHIEDLPRLSDTPSLRKKLGAAEFPILAT